LLVSTSNSGINGYEEHSWQDIWSGSSAPLDAPNSHNSPTSPFTNEGENSSTTDLDTFSMNSAFETLLKTLSNIHTIYLGARTACNSPQTAERASTEAEILSTLQSMDTIGHFILSQVLDIGTQDPPDLSLLSLILASLIRLKEIGALLGQIYTADLGSSNRIQIQQRIQFNVMQTNTALKQVARCHPALESLVDNMFSTVLQTR
jgi:hypothetical protein